MTEATIKSAQPLKQQSVLACRLRKKTVGRAATSPTACEIELENVSGEVVEIEFERSVLQYLNLMVTGPNGTAVSEGHYGDSFSPIDEVQLLRLNPGDKFTGPVSLLGTVPPAKRVPGGYEVRAVYEYRGLRATSEPYSVAIHS